MLATDSEEEANTKLPHLSIEALNTSAKALGVSSPFMIVRSGDGPVDLEDSEMAYSSSGGGTAKLMIDPIKRFGSNTFSLHFKPSGTSAEDVYEDVDIVRINLVNHPPSDATANLVINDATGAELSDTTEDDPGSIIFFTPKYDAHGKAQIPDITFPKMTLKAISSPAGTYTLSGSSSAVSFSPKTASSSVDTNVTLTCAQPITTTTPITFTLDWKATTPSPSPDSEDSNDSGSDSVKLTLVSAAIEPDIDMAGVVGDVIQSSVPGSTIKHFVSPQKTPELDQEYVILKVTGLSADQITKGHASEVVEWDCDKELEELEPKDSE
jgi:hypothetical protein